MTSAQLHCGGNWVGSFQRGPQSNRFQVCLCWLLGVPEQGLFKRSAEQTSKISHFVLVLRCYIFTFCPLFSQRIIPFHILPFSLKTMVYIYQDYNLVANSLDQYIAFFISAKIHVKWGYVIVTERCEAIRITLSKCDKEPLWVVAKGF